MQAEWSEDENDLNLKCTFFYKSIGSFDAFYTQLKEFYYDNELCCEISSEFVM